MMALRLGVASLIAQVYACMWLTHPLAGHVQAPCCPQYAFSHQWVLLNFTNRKLHGSCADVKET